MLQVIQIQLSSQVGPRFALMVDFMYSFFRDRGAKKAFTDG